MVRIARQARGEKNKKLFQIFSRQAVNDVFVTSMARWEEHLRMLVVLERECLALREEVEHLNEKQEVLATLMEGGKMSLQKVAPENYHEKIFEELKELEEQKTREALDWYNESNGKAKGNEQGVGHCSGAFDNSTFGSCSSSMEFDTDDAMSASSKMAPDADEAKSESSSIGLAKGKERDWWSIDLEGAMEKLEVTGPLSGTEGGSVDPAGKMGQRSARTKAARERSKKLKEAEMEKDGEVPQEESVEIRSPKRKVSRVESEETQDYAGDSGNQPGRSRGNELRAERPW